MIQADFHVHTDFSNDCFVSTEKQIESAIKLGLKFICFTDHFDMHLYSDKKYVLDINSYVSKIDNLKEKYKNQIDVLCGIEIGLQPNLKEAINENISGYDFDFIIGSSHAVNNIDIGYNPGKYFKGKSEKEAYLEYFESILENDGPYYIHCLEGKDRTGFVCMVIESLLGATYEEIVDDYFTTYHNYYGIEKGSDNYEVIKSIHIDEMIRYVFDFQESTNLLGANYYSKDTEYLLHIGLTQDQINAVQTKLSKTN